MLTTICILLIPFLSSDDAFRQVASQLSAAVATVSKDHVGGEEWDLEVLEQAAEETFAEGEGGFV